ncbi:hypothetical protein BAUCODRAFT_263193 [Baudoinia panamericana UAMH 10762]|uniref:Uncharacterized protein n=1 Tax=Baudoinia panamericana (strain UAMH 10762) TaxID=717646 RepID=M2MMZ4_BAUPA|nr:uncharacterized protein BAUCODRAFT_263193 [Baudoinia panamericana UAMH 10762]EMC92818.1 hypothetical protein BAUCODRAFT_263193 [Baudoinia panamericana UAMH 10762]
MQHQSSAQVEVMRVSVRLSLAQCMPPSTHHGTAGCTARRCCTAKETLSHCIWSRSRNYFRVRADSSILALPSQQGPCEAMFRYGGEHRRASPCFPQ